MQCLNHWYYPKSEWNLYEPRSPIFSCRETNYLRFTSLQTKLFKFYKICLFFDNCAFISVLLFRICLALILLEYSSIYTRNWKKIPSIRVPCKNITRATSTSTSKFTRPITVYNIVFDAIHILGKLCITSKTMLYRFSVTCRFKSHYLRQVSESFHSLLCCLLG